MHGPLCYQCLRKHVDMLKMWVHKITKTENNPVNHYQNTS